MAADLDSLTGVVQYASVGSLWGAALIRLPSVLRHSHQRGLWLAVTTAALAMTLAVPAVGEATAEQGSYLRELTLAKNLFGVVSAGAVLYFVTISASSRRFATTLCSTVAITLTGLLALALTAPLPVERGLTELGYSPGATTYVLLLIGAHLLANTVCVIACYRYGTSSPSPALALSLQLFGWGTALAGLYWAINLTYFLCVHCDTPSPHLTWLMSLHGLLRAAAILVPTWGALRATAVHISTMWRLWPLWHDLVVTAPHIALTKPRPRLLEILWPSIPYRVMAYRKMIETRDAILLLCPHIRVTASHSDPAVLARHLHQARQSGLVEDWRRPEPAAEPAPLALTAITLPPAKPERTLDEEMEFLLRVAHNYQTHDAKRDL